MVRFLATALTTLALASCVLADAVALTYPGSVNTCELHRLHWYGGSPPYVVTANGGDSGEGPTLVTIDGPTTDTQLFWKVALKAGTLFTFKVVDGTGEQFVSDSIIVGDEGTSTECLPVPPAATSSEAPPSCAV